MDFVLNKISLEDFKEHKDIYSKTIRGNLRFTIETHVLDNGKNLQIFFYRSHDKIKKFVEKALEKDYLTTQKTTEELDATVLRLHINEEDFMINSSGKIRLEVVEYNFNNKEITLSDFEKGKVAVLMNLYFENEIDNAKLKKELKDHNLEDNNETGNIE